MSSTGYLLNRGLVSNCVSNGNINLLNCLNFCSTEHICISCLSKERQHILYIYELFAYSSVSSLTVVTGLCIKKDWKSMHSNQGSQTNSLWVRHVFVWPLPCFLNWSGRLLGRAWILQFTTDPSIEYHLPVFSFYTVRAFLFVPHLLNERKNYCKLLLSLCYNLLTCTTKVSFICNVSVYFVKLPSLKNVLFPGNILTVQHRMICTRLHRM